MTNRLRALAVLVAVFVAGCAIGGGGSYLWLRRVSTNANGQTFQPMRGPDNRRINQLLQLTPEQESQFRTIMADSRKAIDAIRTEEQPKLRAAQEEMNRRISAILNDEQKKKFEDFLSSSRPDRRGGSPDRWGGRRDPNNPLMPPPRK